MLVVLGVVYFLIFGMRGTKQRLNAFTATIKNKTSAMPNPLKSKKKGGEQKDVFEIGDIGDGDIGDDDVSVWCKIIRQRESYAMFTFPLFHHFVFFYYYYRGSWPKSLEKNNILLMFIAV